jgi:Xaa-Pro aminopeptidase
MPDLQAIQKELRASRIGGWLFYDILHRDPIAYRVLGLEGSQAKRRWFYLIPARGAPRKLVHRIEPAMLDSLPGKKILYAAREELSAGLARLLSGVRSVAMQYSPRNTIPYVSTVDAGTVELIRSLGKKVVSSADLVQRFEACWSPAQLRSHLEARKIIDEIVSRAFARASEFVRRGRELTEYDLQQWFGEQFAARGITTDGLPIVAVGPHSGDPHYEPPARSSARIRAGHLLLLDVWGKLDRPESVYYDVTWTGFLGPSIPERYAKIFAIVREARDAAVRFVKERIARRRPVRGFQVDRAARSVIRRAGYARFFTHRTGHSIGREVHGTGANMDDFEMRDDRRILPQTCFSVEPGIYLPEFGIRSEVDVYVGERSAEVTGAVQTELLPLLA